MQFFEIDMADHVWIRADPEEKQDLVAFVDATLATDQIDLLFHAMVIRDEVAALKSAIGDQLAGDWLRLSRYRFVQLCKMAGAWKSFGYGLASPGASLDVPKDLVDEIDALFDAAFPKDPRTTRTPSIR